MISSSSIQGINGKCEMPKLQAIKKGTSIQYVLTLPIDYVQKFEWRKGDVIRIIPKASGLLLENRNLSSIRPEASPLLIDIKKLAEKIRTIPTLFIDLNFLIEFILDCIEFDCSISPRNVKSCKAFSRLEGYSDSQ